MVRLRRIGVHVEAERGRTYRAADLGLRLGLADAVGKNGTGSIV
jgi:hypothetical protein